MGGVNCGQVFEVPLKLVSPQAVYALKKEFRARLRAEFDEQRGVGRQVVLTTIEEHLRYLTLEDTTTYCKRCAFVADKTGMILCSECNKNYHKRHYSRCSKCAGIEQIEIE